MCESPTSTFQGIGYRVQGARCRIQGTGHRVIGCESPAGTFQGPGSRVQGTGHRAQGGRVRVSGGHVVMERVVLDDREPSKL